MSEFYDRQGHPLTLMEWARRYEGKTREEAAAYKRVAETTLATGQWVSTVWVGANYNFFDAGPPLIFETMVFSSKDDMEPLDQDRYSTEAEAVAGHQRMVDKWTADQPVEIP